jgi:hypothetical protein
MLAGPVSLFPCWAGHRLPRLGLWLLTPVGPLAAHPGWAAPFRQASAPAGPVRSLLRLGRCAAFSGWADVTASRLGRLLHSRLGRRAKPGQADFLHVPAGPGRDFSSPGWDSPCQAGLPLPRPTLPPLGQDLLPSDYILHPASTPASCASLATPFGSDWHILHRYMLVLGHPFAQTSILYISCCQPYPQERIRLVTWRSRRYTLEDKDQGHEGQTAMGKAHDHDVVHSTKYGTMLMQATVLTRPQ